jgi:hypothetical protein
VAGRSDLWRWTPLLSAITIYAAAALTFGIGFVLFPIALALSALAYRRTVRPRGFIFWLGSIASAAVTVAGPRRRSGGGVVA